MDKLDYKLIDQLQSQDFQKSTVLAQHLGVGARTVRRRLSAMKNKGIIKVIGVPNPMSYGSWAKIGIKVEPGTLREVANKLIEHQSVYFVAYCLGTFNIMIGVLFETMDQLALFFNSELTRIKGIASAETMMLLCPRKYYNFSWPEPVWEDKGDGKGASHNSASYYNYNEIDDMDRRIMDYLMKDALTPVKVLKSRLGIGESTIRNRIKRLLKLDIFRIEAVPNPELLEYEVWATMGVTINHQFAHKVINSIIKNPAVYLASVSVGRFNIIIAARFQNLNLLNDFVGTELAEIEGISAIETFLLTKPLKYHTIKW